MLKKAIRKLLSRFGLRISRIHKIETYQGPLHFGPYIIETNYNELLQSYRNYPETNAVIGRLVKLIATQSPISMIDIGANCGDSLAIAKCSADIEVLCVEGDHSLVSCLRGNISQFSGVTIKECYLGEQCCRLAVDIEKRGYNNTLSISGDSPKETVSIHTLDEIVATWPALSHLRLIKCDTEGHDVRILHGAYETILNHKPVLIFEYNRLAMQSACEEGFRVFSYLKSLGYYHMMFYDAFGRFLLSCTLEQQDILMDLHEYADGRLGKVFYYDMLAFSREDDSLAKKFLNLERQYRKLILSKIDN